MKKLILLVLLFAFIPLVLAQEAPYDTAWVCYTMDDADTTSTKANDVISGLTARLVSAPTSQVGIKGECRYFDGAADYFIVNQSDMVGWLNAVDSQDWAVSFWVNTTTFTAGKNLGETRDSDQQPQIELGVLTGVGNLRFQQKDDSAQYTIIQPANPITNNVWEHIVVVWYDSNNTMKVYNQGSIFGTNAGSNPTTTQFSTSEYFTMMAQNTGGTVDDWVNGCFDEFAIWNSSLTKSQVITLYGGGTSPPSCTATPDTSPPVLSAYNMTSEGGCITWRTNKLNPCNTTDTTATVTLTTDENAWCRIDTTVANFTGMTAANCTGGGTTSQTCTVAAGDAVTTYHDLLYVACTDASGNENLTGVSSSGPLNITTNIAPTFDQNPADVSISHCGTLSVDYNCTDSFPSTDTVTYTDNETKVTTNSGTGIVTDSPGKADAGSYDVQVTCSDGHAYNPTGTDVFVYTVTDASPSISPVIPNMSMSHCTDLSVDVNATDADSCESLTYYVNESAVSINVTTGVISDNHAKGAASYSILITVNDTLGAGSKTGTNIFEYTVSDATPVLSTAAPDVSISHCGSFSHDANATDADTCDSITYTDNETIVDTVAGTGVVSDSPVAADEGTYSVKITASDGVLEDTDIFTYQVNNTAPVISHSCVAHNISFADTLSYDINATDTPDSCDTLTYTDNETIISTASSTGIVTDDPVVGDIGTYSVLTTVSDGVKSSTCIWNYIVRDTDTTNAFCSPLTAFSFYYNVSAGTYNTATNAYTEYNVSMTNQTSCSYSLVNNDVKSLNAQAYLNQSHVRYDTYCNGVALNTTAQTVGAVGTGATSNINCTQSSNGAFVNSTDVYYSPTITWDWAE